MTVEALATRMTAREFAEWQLMDAHEGLPDRRADHHTALLASILANAYRTRGRPPYTPKDFLPRDPWAAPPAAPRRAPGAGIPRLIAALDRLADR